MIKKNDCILNRRIMTSAEEYLSDTVLRMQKQTKQSGIAVLIIFHLIMFCEYTKKIIVRNWMRVVSLLIWIGLREIILPELSGIRTKTVFVFEFYYLF